MKSKTPVRNGRARLLDTLLDIEQRSANPGYSMIGNLTIGPRRLWDTLIETAQFCGTAKGGIGRLILSNEDRQVRDGFKAQCATAPLAHLAFERAVCV